MARDGAVTSSEGPVVVFVGDAALSLDTAARLVFDLPFALAELR